MIISVLNQKGGAGKTTIAINLARRLTLDDDDTLLVDSDPQGSARNWHVNSNGELLRVIGLDRPTIDKDVKKLALHYKWIIVDGAPQLSEMATKTVICSDFVLIPVQPSPYDIWATQDTVDVIKQRQNITDGKPKAAFVISRNIVNTRIGKEVRQVLERFELPIFNSMTCQRIAYSKSAKGSTVFDDSHCEEAKSEIENIYTELKEFIK